MKLKKISESSGFTIVCEIGNHFNKSYWSGPLPNIDHAGIEYIKGRYPIITTEERANTFKRLYKNLWIEVSDYQKELMQNCLGLNNSKKPYRNRCLAEESDKDWNILFEKGLAYKGSVHPNDDKYIFFYLTKQGVEYVLGKSVSSNMYEEL